MNGLAQRAAPRYERLLRDVRLRQQNPELALSGSTTLNGLSVIDLNSTMPYVQGGLVNSPGEPNGQINVRESATIVFRVRINDTLPLGVKQISNQAMTWGKGIANVFTNDPSTLEAGDPTTLFILNPTAIG